MRLNLEANGEAFAKQVAATRRKLDSMHTQGGPFGVSARMLRGAYLPYLVVLRTELRDDVVPTEILEGAADLIANMAKTTVQTLIEAPPDVEGQTIEELLMKACHIACQAIKAEADAKKPRLELVKGAPEPEGGGTVIHLNPKKKGK